MTFRVVIPARYASTRLPGKPLRTIAGQAMIQHVYHRAVESGAKDVIVASDDQRVIDACKEFGAEVLSTSSNHASGTDRVAEVARELRWDPDDIVINVQGDEPLIPPANIRQVADLLQRHPESGMATLCTPVHGLAELLDPNVVKLVLSESGRALYFSRAPIPWHREGAHGTLETQIRYEGAMRHIGLYGYRVHCLLTLAGTPPTQLESIEHLEQLRALWFGIEIRAEIAAEIPGPGVDTPDDLAKLNELLREKA